MAWIELSLTIHSNEQQRIELALEDLGALSVTLLDAEDHPIFEPAPGETPVWPTIKLAALFDIVVDRAGLVHALTDLVPEITPDQLEFRDVPDADWVRAWMDTFQPMQFGRRLWIYPWNIEPPAGDGDVVVVRLDPGLAFGTGTHPTTALCLEWLDGLDLHGKTLLDYGCGSGVLAIAALKLGAAHVIGVDLDPQALEASRDNAERNGVADGLALHLPQDYASTPQDLLVANILAGPLGELAPLFAQACKPGAPFALSGILAGQHEELLVRYGEWFEALEVAQREDWVRISGRRR
ncbi:50S ribosomal protein L11 methyltransferase [Tahibacter sp. UC22_41]|uniref:50S ribosomal protein L11 methyltransferase n=1 Tax=Tahibacter sp. UC22_41 TaxID=3350178 RepID=UPI0036DF13C0